MTTPDTTLANRDGFNFYAERKSMHQAVLLGVDVSTLRNGQWAAKIYLEWVALTREARERYIEAARGRLEYASNLPMG